MKKLIFSFFLFAMSMLTFAQGTYALDAMHSSFNFNIKHMGISFVQGRFDKFEGTVQTPGKDFNNAKFDFKVDVNSINTAVEMRDGHLKNADFFDVEKYPAMTFVSTSTKKAKGNDYTVTGNLTIKGVTKPVTVTVNYGGQAKNQQGAEVIGIQTKFKINRLDYGINYDPTGAGIAKDVEISVFAELVKK